MESTEEPMRFVVYTEIEDRHETGFLPKGMNEYFFCRGHPFQKGDKVKITIQKVPDVHPDNDHQDQRQHLEDNLL